MAASIRGAWPLAAASLVAWLLLLTSSVSPALPRFCGAAGQFWTTMPAGMETAMRITPPHQLLLSWLLMLCAMMLPLLHSPLAAVRARSRPGRRIQAMVTFLAAYAAAWTLAFVPIAATAAVLILAAPFEAAAPVAALCIAVAWQATTIKARCREGCRLGPPLPLHTSDPGSLHHGFATAKACVGSCWALMALPLFFGEAHLLAMAAVAMVMLDERYPARPAGGTAKPAPRSAPGTEAPGR